MQLNYGETGGNERERSFMEFALEEVKDEQLSTKIGKIDGLLVHFVMKLTHESMT